MLRTTRAPPLSAGLIVISLFFARHFRDDRSPSVIFCLVISFGLMLLSLISFRLMNVSSAGDPVGALQFDFCLSLYNFPTFECG